MLNSLTQFMSAYSLTFKDPHEQRKATSKLLDLSQDSGSALDYVTTFTTLLYLLPSTRVLMILADVSGLMLSPILYAILKEAQS